MEQHRQEAGRWGGPSSSPPPRKGKGKAKGKQQPAFVDVKTDVGGVSMSYLKAESPSQRCLGPSSSEGSWADNRNASPRTPREVMSMNI